MMSPEQAIIHVKTIDYDNGNSSIKWGITFSKYSRYRITVYVST